LHRFVSEDPIGVSGGDAGLYVYVRNQPSVMTDPLGLEPTDCGGFLGCLSPGLWQWITLGSALACAFGLPCVFATGLVFFLKEVALWQRYGIGGPEFWISTVFNFGTTVVPVGIGALLSRSLAAGAGVMLTSRFGGRLFWANLPSAACAGWSWCASPSWDWPPAFP
jgi:hypothetical protein